MIGETEVGDRTVAGLLSALAEAPDFASAASFLLAQVLDQVAPEPGRDRDLQVDVAVALRDQL